jgi:hypothetical protein
MGKDWFVPLIHLRVSLFSWAKLDQMPHLMGRGLDVSFHRLGSQLSA